MDWALKQLDPRGRTTRATYWLTWIGATIIVALLSMVHAPTAVRLPIAIASGPVTLLLTIRRLRDAGRSPWIALWFLFPADIDVSLATISFYSYQIHLIDIGAVLRMLPILIGLLSRSRIADSRPLVTSPVF